jgi:hypothetical protein
VLFGRESVDVTTAQEPRKRGRPRTHPSWTDEFGISRAFSAHPNRNAVREVIERNADQWPYERIWPAWRDDLVTAVYEITEIIGMKPSRWHRLEVIEPRDDLMPETVLWWLDPSRFTRAARYGFERRVEAGDPHALAELSRQPLNDAEVLNLRRYEASAQRGFRDCDCLPPSFECELHADARRADDEEPGLA